ncbi:ABC transporter substrate-binding protein [Nitrincola alkalilacustris]|uniref:ABC transporter substrate-binding protein n=1 Tax=Nitrincola alkalilacustris TaxID=1571224 RepID=UPI00124DA05D|nr:ABC transporter substrate binding protein [Nitrincola alkalilacustris]
MAICLAVTQSVAAERTPLLIFSDQGDAYATLLKTLEQELKITLETAYLQQGALDQEKSLDRTIVAVGTRACEFVIRNAQPSTRVLCTFLPSQAFTVLSQNHQASLLFINRQITALFMDQPFSRQLILARIIQPNMTSVGSVFGPSSRVLEADFVRVSTDFGMRPVYTLMNESDNPVRVLTPIISDSDVFIAIPDSSVFNRTAAKWILYISLRNRIPLIGFSTSYVDAGAVLGIYSTPTQVGRHTADLIKTMSSSAELPEPQYPQYYTVSVNRTAARTLRLDLPPLELIEEALRTSELLYDRQKN